MSFSLEQLRALDAVVRYGGFTKASKHLHRVPSALTYLIRGLEEQLEVKLFERQGRRAVLTEAGSKILRHARAVLESSAGLERAAQELRDGWEAELAVVVDGALPQGRITHCLRRFADPDVPTRLRVDIEYQEGVIDRFHSGEAEIGLCLGFRGDGDEKGYHCHPLEPLELLLVAGATHPLAKGVVTPERRAPHAELITRDSSPRFAREFKPSFEGSKTTVFLSDFHSKRAALLAGAGYGWIPKHFVESDLKTGALVILETEPNRWTYSPQVITQPDKPIGRGARLFLETLLEEPFKVGDSEVGDV